MNVGIRFLSPVPDERDYESLSKMFNKNIKILHNVLNTAPYEISILSSLLIRLEEKVNNLDIGK